MYRPLWLCVTLAITNAKHMCLIHIHVHKNTYGVNSHFSFRWNFKIGNLKIPFHLTDTVILMISLESIDNCVSGITSGLRE